MKHWLTNSGKTLNFTRRATIAGEKRLSIATPGLPQLGTFRGPALELVEDLALLVLVQGWTATCSLALIDETRELRLEPLNVGRRDYLRATLQPMCRGREAPPAGQVGH